MITDSEVYYLEELANQADGHNNKYRWARKEAVNNELAPFMKDKAETLFGRPSTLKVTESGFWFRFDLPDTGEYVTFDVRETDRGALKVWTYQANKYHPSGHGMPVPKAPSVSGDPRIGDVNGKKDHYHTPFGALVAGYEAVCRSGLLS